MSLLESFTGLSKSVTDLTNTVKGKFTFWDKKVDDKILEIEEWKSSKEIYCTAVRDTGWETHLANTKFGIIGNFYNNKGFSADIGIGLLSGSYIIVPKTGKYRVTLQMYVDDDKQRERLYVMGTVDDAESWFDVVFCDPANSIGGDYKVSNSTIRHLEEGVKLYYHQSEHGASSLYHSMDHTEFSINYLGA